MDCLSDPFSRRASTPLRILSTKGNDPSILPKILETSAIAFSLLYTMRYIRLEAHTRSDTPKINPAMLHSIGGRTPQGLTYAGLLRLSRILLGRQTPHRGKSAPP